MEIAKDSPKKRLRVYEQWQGNERFFCGGRLVAGPSWKASFGTAALILLPTVVYLVLVAWYLGQQINIAIFVVSCIIPIFCLLWLSLTACRDPGIIPRQEPDQEYLTGCKPRTKEVMVNNQRVVIRYNDTCHFYQPPRAHHCSVNDNCIERFDHHCPWVGTTIGKRNYRTFLLFVYTSTALCIYVFGVCLTTIFQKHDELVAAAQRAGKSGDGLWSKSLGQVESIAAIAVMVYVFIFFFFVGGLSGFHAYLTATNQTTYENFRYNKDSSVNPYSRGILRNCWEVWCTPIPASQVQFRAWADEWRPPPGQPQSPYCDIPVGQGDAQAEQDQQDLSAYGSQPPTDTGEVNPHYAVAPPGSQYQPPRFAANHTSSLHAPQAAAYPAQHAYTMPAAHAMEPRYEDDPRVSAGGGGPLGAGATYQASGSQRHYPAASTAAARGPPMYYRHEDVEDVQNSLEHAAYHVDDQYAAHADHHMHHDDGGYADDYAGYESANRGAGHMGGAGGRDGAYDEDAEEGSPRTPAFDARVYYHEGPPAPSPSLPSSSPQSLPPAAMGAPRLPGWPGAGAPGQGQGQAYGHSLNGPAGTYRASPLGFGGAGR